MRRAVGAAGEVESCALVHVQVYSALPFMLYEILYKEKSRAERALIVILSSHRCSSRKVAFVR